MFEIFGIPSQALFGQLLLGLINGSFYALLSLGLAVIFGMLNIINFTHGAQYMMGAFAAYMLLQYLGINYWAALVIVPILVGAIGILIERLFLQAPAKARSPLRTDSHVRPGADHRGPVPQLLRLLRASPMTCRTRCKAGAISASCFCPIIAPG